MRKSQSRPSTKTILDPFVPTHGTFCGPGTSDDVMTSPPESLTDGCCKGHDLAYGLAKTERDIALADRDLSECLVGVRDDAGSMGEYFYNYAAEATMDAKAKAGGVHPILPQRERKKRVPRGFPKELKSELGLDLMKSTPSVSTELIESENLKLGKAPVAAVERKIGEKSQAKKVNRAARKAARKEVKKIGPRLENGAFRSSQRNRNPKKVARRQVAKRYNKRMRNAIVKAGVKNLNPRFPVADLFIRSAGRRQRGAASRDYIRVCGSDLWFSYSVPSSPPAVGSVINSVVLNPTAMQNMRLQILGLLFQKFIFKRFSVHYEPMSSTQSSGGMIMYVDLDPTTNYQGSGGTNLQIAMAHSGDRAFAIYNPATARLLDKKDRTEYWVDLAAATDVRTSAQGVAIVMAAETMTANTGAGLFIVSYDLEFVDWSLNAQSGPTPAPISPWIIWRNSAAISMTTSIDYLSAFGYNEPGGVQQVVSGYNPADFYQLTFDSSYVGHIHIGRSEIGDIYHVMFVCYSSGAYGQNPGLTQDLGTGIFAVTGDVPTQFGTGTWCMHKSITCTAAGDGLFKCQLAPTASITSTTNDAYIFVWKSTTGFRKKLQGEDRLSKLENELNLLRKEYGAKPVNEFLGELKNSGHIPRLEKTTEKRLLEGRSIPQQRVEQIRFLDREESEVHDPSSSSHSVQTDDEGWCTVHVPADQNTDMLEFMRNELANDDKFRIVRLKDEEKFVYQVKTKSHEQRKEDRKSVG